VDGGPIFTNAGCVPATAGNVLDHRLAVLFQPPLCLVRQPWQTE